MGETEFVKEFPQVCLLSSDEDTSANSDDELQKPGLNFKSSLKITRDWNGSHL
jgi:hypothetical protein